MLCRATHIMLNNKGLPPTAAGWAAAKWPLVLSLLQDLLVNPLPTVPSPGAAHTQQLHKVEYGGLVPSLNSGQLSRATNSRTFSYRAWPEENVKDPSTLDREGEGEVVILSRHCAPQRDTLI